MDKQYFFDVVINEEKLSSGEPVFVAHCTSLGIASQGSNITEALVNIKEAVSLYLEEMPEKLEEFGTIEKPPTFSFIEVRKDAKATRVIG